MNKTNVERAINIVDGKLELVEGELLYELAKEGTVEGVIVEIGTYLGKSAICLGLGTKDANREKVYTIDIVDRIKKINEFLEAFNVEDYVIPIVGNSLDVAKTWDKLVRLLFIDGSHLYEDVKVDFLSWEPHVAKNGIIVFHDALEYIDPNGPFRVINEILVTNKQKYKFMNGGNMTVYSKLCD